MSQSPLARSTRRSLPAFAHPPSRLSKSTSIQNLRSRAAHDDEEDDDSEPLEAAPSPAVARKSTPRASTAHNTPTGTKNRYKDAASSTPTASGRPSHSQSPKIVYSPYANNSPHAGPSRSSSIPFDMAASAKDARRKSMGASLRRDSTPTPGAGDAGSEREGTPVPVPASKKRKAFIRKRPLTTRILELPQTLIDRFQYDLPQSIHDILPDAHLANPIALGLHVVHYLLLAPLFPGHTELGSVLRGREKGRWERFEDEHAARGRSIASGWTSILITLIMLILTAGNTAYLFSRYKTYDMQLRSASDPVHSPHASPAPGPRAQKQDRATDVFDPADKETNKLDTRKLATMAGRGLWLMARFLFSASMSAIGKPTHHTSSGVGSSGGDDRIQTLRVWEPPAFCLAFFCAIPPTAPLLTHILSSLHPLLTPLIHLSTAFLLSHLATSFNQLVKDRMFLSAEVMREYDQRFVYKKVFSSRVDRAVMTNEAELVW